MVICAGDLVFSAGCEFAITTDQTHSTRCMSTPTIWVPLGAPPWIELGGVANRWVEISFSAALPPRQKRRPLYVGHQIWHCHPLFPLLGPPSTSLWSADMFLTQ